MIIRPIYGRLTLEIQEKLKKQISKALETEERVELDIDGVHLQEIVSFLIDIYGVLGDKKLIITSDSYKKINLISTNFCNSGLCFNSPYVIEDERIAYKKHCLDLD